MRVIVCGGRTFADAELLQRELRQLNLRKPVSVLIHGWLGPAAPVAERWARANGIPVVRYPPNRDFHGKQAEIYRNSFMISDGRPDLVVAFPGGPATADLVQRALNEGIAVLTVPGPIIEAEGPRKGRATCVDRNVCEPSVETRPCHISTSASVALPASAA